MEIDFTANSIEVQQRYEQKLLKLTMEQENQSAKTKSRLKEDTDKISWLENHVQTLIEENQKLIQCLEQANDLQKNPAALQKQSKQLQIENQEKTAIIQKKNEEITQLKLEQERLS